MDRPSAEMRNTEPCGIRWHRHDHRPARSFPPTGRGGPRRAPESRERPAVTERLLARAKRRQGEPRTGGEDDATRGQPALAFDGEAVGDRDSVEPVREHQARPVEVRLRAGVQVGIRRRSARRVLGVDAELVHDSLESLLAADRDASLLLRAGRSSTLRSGRTPVRRRGTTGRKARRAAARG